MPVTVLPWRHFLLALAVVAVWGSNFVVIHHGLEHFPPILFAALRFSFVLLPALLFVRRPPVPWRHLAGYGLLIGAGQFALLYLAMSGRISPGLASLVMQVQVFITIGLSMWLTGERLRLSQGIALGLATAGILVIALHTDRTTTVLGLALTIAAASCWAGGNIVGRLSGPVDMVGYVVWSSLFAAPPLILLSLLAEGPETLRQAIATASPAAWGAVVWQSWANSLFGYAIWGWLLARHPAALVAPMALLVPVFGLGASALLLGEALPPWKLAAAALVIGGLAIGMFGSRLRLPLAAARRPGPAA
jgi:O-acetylserine/cysteine efflux transporter